MREDTPATLAPGLRESGEGKQTVIVRLRPGEVSRSSADGGGQARMRSRRRQRQRRTLEEAAEQVQRPVEAFARARDGVEIVNQFWLANAVVLTVDTDRVPLASVAQIQGVRQIHENIEVTVASGHRGEGTTETAGPPLMDHGQHTYGLEQIYVPDVWDEHGTQGEGIRIAVLDTGIDSDHQDLELYTDDPDDPTYPGGWAEIDSNGNVVGGSEPHDTGAHGTHVSGTVAGGDEGGEHIGVAPEAELMHGLVLPGGSGTFAQIVGGMEWALSEDADVINMSLAARGYASSFVEPMRNALTAGTLPVSAIANDGEGTSGSPGNLYDGLGVGASNASEDIWSGSSGELVDTDSDWGNNAPADWPDEYIVPDVAAPGQSVLSSIPGDSYQYYTGTSMASPHVAGVAGLMLAAADDPTPQQLVDALEETAWKPDDWDEDDAQWAIDGKDSRYGTGIVDAKAAVDQVTEPVSDELTFDAQEPDGGVVTATDVTTAQESTVVLTYADDGSEYVSGYNPDADNLGMESVEVEIEDASGFPGEHTAWLFDDDDLPGDLDIGDDLSDYADDALDSETDSVTAGDIAVCVSVDSMAVGEETEVAVTAENVDQLTVQKLWTDWDVSDVDDDGASTDPRVGDDGEYEFEWDSQQALVTPTMTVEPPEDTYRDGAYEIRVTVGSPDDDETTTVLEITA